MAQFSEMDISEAKRRVQEMRSRASRYVPDSTEKPENKTENNIPPQPEGYNEGSEDKRSANEDKGEDKSFFVILALILLLSREGADNTLILALLYLLL